MIDSSKKKLFAKIPSITELLSDGTTEKLLKEYPERYVTKTLRSVVEELRSEILSGQYSAESDIPALADLTQKAEKKVREGLGNKIMKVINAAGVILHTGLGRAALPASAQDALREAAERYCLLATDRDSGKRGDRYRHTDELLCELSGAEASLVVNNNSAAVMLALNTFGFEKESIVSRGELVEIGGAFRVPDVMRRSGTIMVEVGTTNKTHPRDYESAINEETAVLLKVHTSNYRIEGFQKEVGVGEMAQIAHKNGLIVLMDLGSGALVDIRRWGLAYEPTVPESVGAGADVVTFSGDKMVGGPQCGIIVGKKEVIKEMATNPLMRAFRCGKLTLSALNGTLRCFLDIEKLPELHPVYHMIAAPVDVVKRRAQKLARRIRKIEGISEFAEIKLEDSITEMGSGSLPARGIPTKVVAIKPKRLGAEKTGKHLRLANPAVFTRIENENVIFDARTILDSEISGISDALEWVAGNN